MAGMPPRSPLVRLMPLGVGTPYIESLRSLFLRLADATSVSPTSLYNFLQSPDVDTESVVARGRMTAIWDAPSFVGMGIVPKGLVQILERVTMVSQLGRLTLLPLAGKIAACRSIHQRRRWCPLCLKEGMEAGNPYGQLLWDLEPVVACPKHRILLHSECRCDTIRKLNWEGPKLLPHLCKHCGNSLGFMDQAALIEAPPTDVTRAACLGELLKSELFLGDIKPNETAGVAQFLKIAFHSWPNCKLPRVADLIHRNKSYLSYWKNGVHLPSLGSVIELADAFGCRLESVLTGDGAREKEPVSIEPTPRASRRAPIDPVPTALRLLAFLKWTPPPSLAEIGRQIGINCSTLAKRFPDITKMLVMNRKQVRRESAEKLHRKRATAYKTTALALVEQGIHPTRKRVKDALGPGFADIHPVDREACRRACQEAIVGWRKSEQGPN